MRMKTIGYISTTIVLMAYGAVLNGWALAKLWLWFIVTAFKLPVLSIPAAIGVALVVGYLTREFQADRTGRSYGAVLVDSAIMFTLKPVAAVLIGAVVRLWL